MTRTKAAVAAAGLGLAVGMTAAGQASARSAPARATIKAVQTLKMKPNRYIQDGLRWDRDVYRVRSGGTVTVLNNAADEGPHTLSVVRRGDLPRTAAQAFNCRICRVFEKAHGAQPESDAPPQFLYVENGVGQATAPNVDRPGDSGVTGPGRKGEKITLKVTARRGTTLYFMCAIHPWMQARIAVG